ncbi:60S ribosomal protein L5 [Ancistrocladus abbreviatus]
MTFVKAQKTKAYFKRFQVKFKRRREGKADYRARTRLINQDKNKYNTPRYRFVVRFDIIAQIISASITGDIMLVAAYGHELPQYGLEVGLKTMQQHIVLAFSLLIGFLKMLEMDEEYEGNVEAIREDFLVEPAESRRPFRALLDVGLVRTTTRNDVFGALKGALDGGLDIPHSDKRFVGFSKDGKQLDLEVHRKYIYGGHVAAYMRNLMEDEPEKYQTHFSEYIKRGIEADDMEELYKKVHAAIRADPTAKKSEKEPPKEHKRGDDDEGGGEGARVEKVMVVVDKELLEVKMMGAVEKETKVVEVTMMAKKELLEVMVVVVRRMWRGSGDEKSGGENAISGGCGDGGDNGDVGEGGGEDDTIGGGGKDDGHGDGRDGSSKGGGGEDTIGAGGRDGSGGQHRG